MSVLENIPRIEDKLRRAQFDPPMSEWWRNTLESFYKSNCRQLVLRVGRRGGKSSTLCRVAVLEAWCGDHKIPPGDIGVVAFISTTRQEASERIRTIKKLLDALKIKHRPAESGLELVDKPILFRIFPASITGVSGFTAISIIADEVSKWRDSDSGVNPATEVLGSLRPTIATQKNARIFLSSSPFGMEDAHAAAYDAGDSEFQMTASAPTWVANPTVTEEATHSIEPDPRIWAREFAAVPQAAALGAFDPEAIARAFRPPPTDGTQSRRILVLDPSSGRKDAWTWAIVSRRGDVLCLERIDGIKGRFFQQLRAEDIVHRLATMAREHALDSVHADQREAFTLEGAFRQHGLRYVVHDWTNASKVEAVERLRRRFADGTIVLPEHEQLRKELHAFEERITASGAITFAARGSGHDDYVALLITAMMAELNGFLTPHVSGVKLTSVQTQDFETAPIG